jgi:hypothetical protein
VPTFLSLHIEYLIGHGPHRKHRVQQFFYCCVCIRCRGNVFTEPLPSNKLLSINKRGNRQPHRQQGDLISLPLSFQNKESGLKILTASINNFERTNKRMNVGMYLHTFIHRYIYINTYTDTYIQTYMTVRYPIRINPSVLMYVADYSRQADFLN